MVLMWLKSKRDVYNEEWDKKYWIRREIWEVKN